MRFEKRVIERRATNKDSKIAKLLVKLDEGLAKPQIETTPLFVSCFSEKPDDLSQWRAYGHESGYAIRVDAAQLRSMTVAAKANPMLLKVGYNPDAHKQIFDDILLFAEKFYVEFDGRSAAPTEEEWLEEFGNFLAAHLSHIAICIKHPAFEAEAEWRMVYTFGPDDPKRIIVRQGASMLKRHIVLPLAKPLPISEIMIGPARYPEISRIGVGDLLVKGGFAADQVPVTVTNVPYRT